MNRVDLVLCDWWFQRSRMQATSDLRFMWIGLVFDLLRGNELIPLSSFYMWFRKLVLQDFFTWNTSDLQPPQDFFNTWNTILLKNCISWHDVVRTVSVHIIKWSYYMVPYFLHQPIVTKIIRLNLTRSLLNNFSTSSCLQTKIHGTKRSQDHWLR